MTTQLRYILFHPYIQLCYILFHPYIQLCATLHVRMVRVLLMTPAVVQQDMWEKDAMKQVGPSALLELMYTLHYYRNISKI